MIHPLIAVMNRTPIDRQASRVASQRNCAVVDLDLCRDDLVRSLDRLQRKMRLMKSVLKVATKCQHKNLLARHKNGRRGMKGRPARLVVEYANVGASIQSIMLQIHEMEIGPGRKLRKLIGAMENKWKDEHPGCIFDGQKLVAPNGAVFNRAIETMMSKEEK